jgi:hypothetical protein
MNAALAIAVCTLVGAVTAPNASVAETKKVDGYGGYKFGMTLEQALKVRPYAKQIQCDYDDVTTCIEYQTTISGRRHGGRPLARCYGKAGALASGKRPAPAGPRPNGKANAKVCPPSVARFSFAATGQPLREQYLGNVLVRVGVDDRERHAVSVPSTQLIEAEQI